MKKLLFIIFFAVFMVSCKRDKCNYDKTINTIFVMGWNDSVPSKGCVYAFDKGDAFKHAIDSMKIRNMRMSNIDSYKLICSLIGGNFNYRNDIRLVLNDTLIYDITDFNLAWFVDKRHWTMGGPREFCIVSSFKVNGHQAESKLGTDALMIYQKHVRILKKR